MLEAGFVAEVEALRAAGHGETIPVQGGTGYREICAYLDGEYDLDEAVRRMKNAHHRLVRRQAAWFRDTDPRIHWLEAGPDAAASAIEQARAWLATRSAAPAP